MILKNNLPIDLLQQISSETRADLKSIEKLKGLQIFRRDKEDLALKIFKTLLQSKYIYCTALQIFEMFDKQDFFLNINNSEIEITAFSIIHILNRHFAQLTKPNSTKSFHKQDFKPKYLNVQLKGIFDLIDSSGYMIGQPINKIAFQHKTINYLIFINQRIKQEKGKGNLTYYRLETFYPITDEKELETLISEYEPKKINEELSIYCKK